MNRRRIANHLKKIHNNWVESIQDENVRTLARNNSIITGGAIVSLLTGEQPKDYDIYFTNKETVLEIAKYYVNIFNIKEGNNNASVIDGADYQDETEQQEKYEIRGTMYANLTEDRVKIITGGAGVLEDEDETQSLNVYEILNDTDDAIIDPPVEEKKKGKDKPEPYRPVFLSTNAVTLSDRIQLIIRFYGEPDEIHDTFDFVHTFSYWRSGDFDELHLNAEALEAILDKNLVYKGSKYPLCSIIRLRKFLKRGWKINAGQILKICFQLSDLDLSNPDVLEDQLIGVDTAYFMKLVRDIREQMDANDEFIIDQNYVTTIAEKIFG